MLLRNVYCIGGNTTVTAFRKYACIHNRAFQLLNHCVFKVSLEQCRKQRCSEATGYGSVKFCCCFGHECNRMPEMWWRIDRRLIPVASCKWGVIVFFFQFHTRSCWSPSFSDSRLILVDKICALWGIPPLSWHIRFSTVRSQSGADHSFSWEFFLTHSRILILHIIFLSYTPSFSSSISLISLRSPLPDRKVLRKGR